jgi:hypothetical protein
MYLVEGGVGPADRRPDRHKHLGTKQDLGARQNVR